MNAFYSNINTDNKIVYVCSDFNNVSIYELFCIFTNNKNNKNDVLVMNGNYIKKLTNAKNKNEYFIQY